MAREETIKVILDHKDADNALLGLANDARLIKKEFASIKIGDTAKAVREQASASREASKAAEESAKAQKLAADAEKARYQSVKALEEATKAHLQAEKEAAATATAQQKTRTEAARTLQEMAKAHKEVTNAQTAEIRQSQMLARENERQATAMRRLGENIGQVNAAQATSIQYMTQWIRGQHNLANTTVTATGAIHNAAGDFQTYNAAATEAGGVTHNFRIAVDQATGEVYQLDKGIKTTALSLTDLSVIFRAIRTVVGFTGIAQSFRQAFSEMKNMSDAMAEYRKVTGATAEEMETLRGTAYEVAKAYGESASGVIASAANMARAGYKENSLAMAELATKTKLVGDMTQEAADKFLIAVDAAYKYKGNVEQLSAVLDAANALDNQYATTIEKISDGMTLVASLASTAHVPVEQLMAALGTMTAVTQRSGSETARGLRSIILNVMGDTSTEIEEGVTATEESVKSMTDALIRYGDESVKAAAKAGKIINPMEAIVSLQKAWKENQISEQDLYQISNEIAGKRYYNVFTALIQNPEMFNDMLQSISQSMGSAQNEIDILMDSWSKKLERLKTTWTQLVNQSISEGFIKDLIDGATAALEFAGSLENLAIAGVGAYEVIRSLAAGIKNLRAGEAFGGFNLGLGIAGLAVTAFGVGKAAYEKSIRDMQEAAAQAVANAMEQSSGVKTLENLMKRYSEIASDGIQTERGELEELKTLQDELNGLVGDQAIAIDIVNGKYGETIVQLQNLTREQKAAAETSIRASLSEAVAAFNRSDLNGFFKTAIDDRFEPDSTGRYRRYSMTGVGLDAYANQYVQAYLESSNYLKALQSLGGYTLFFNKPDNAEEIVAFYKEVQDFYTFLGSTTATGEKAAKGAKSLGEEYSGMYSALGQFIQAIKNAQAGNIESALEALGTLNEELEEISESGGAAESAAEGIDTVTESAYGLADAIDAATDAKSRFDEAMKTNKADAFNDYVQAFQTLQGEIDAGRVNSTAFYASARMLLGDEAYNATGGSTEAVMAALNRSGRSGSAMGAYDILSATYKNAEGKAVEGYGAYELLTRTRGYEGRLTNEAGLPSISEITQADLEAISREWGNLSVDFLKHFFVAALNASDQYDIKGEATDAAVQAGKTADANAEAEQSTRKAADGMEMVYEADGKLAQAAEEAAETISEASDTIAEAAQEAESEGEGEPTEPPASVAPDTEQARKDAEEWLAVLDEIEAAYIRIDEMSVGHNPDLEALIADIDKLRETVTLNIQTGAGSGVSALMAASIAGSIATINSYAKDGKIDITVASKLTGSLNKDLLSIVENAQTLDELEGIELAITGNETPLDEEIAAAIAKQRESITLDVNANTEQAGKDIDSVADKSRTATITANADAEQAKYDVDDAAKNRETVISVTQTGASEASTDIDDAAKNRDAVISVTQTGASTVSAEIDNAARNRESRVIVKWENEDGTSHTGTGGKFATGTRSHPGGLSLVNDGNGPELIVDRGRAFIAGDGKPAIVNLQKGAKVFTASETRQIFNGSGIPAYSLGTGLFREHPEAAPVGGWTQITYGSFATRDNGDGGSGSSSGQEGSNSGNSGGNSGGETKTYKFEDLEDAIDYIIERVGMGLDEQLEILDKQIEALKLEKEKAEQENELEQKRKDLAEAQNNRTVRYIDENGEWHWMADQNAVQKASDALKEYEDELAFNARIDALEAQKTALQEQYNKITKAWSDIQYAVNTPTGDIYETLANVIASGTPTDKKGAETVQNLLISTLLKGGIYSGNYDEAVESIRRASAGDPIMPGESEATLASLIATAASGGTGTETMDAMRAATLGISTGGSYFGVSSGGSQTNYNYFINGMQLSQEQSNQPLSSIMRELTVYTNTGVA